MSIKRRKHVEQLKVRLWNETQNKMPGVFQELRSNYLRNWYNVGQHYFDACKKLLRLERHDDLLECIDQELDDLNDVQREGFLMGFQAARWADENECEQATRGAHREEPEIDFNEQRKGSGFPAIL